MIKVAYSRKVDLSSGHLMSVKEFISVVKTGGFIDYDGFGHPVKDDKIASMIIKPSKLKDIPSSATHIMWYNR